MLQTRWGSIGGQNDAQGTCPGIPWAFSPTLSHQPSPSGLKPPFAMIKPLASKVSDSDCSHILLKPGIANLKRYQVPCALGSWPELALLDVRPCNLLLPTLLRCFALTPPPDVELSVSRLPGGAECLLAAFLAASSLSWFFGRRTTPGFSSWKSTQRKLDWLRLGRRRDFSREGGSTLVSSP